MVFFTTRCQTLVSRYENKGLVNYVEITKELQRFFVRPQFRKIPTPNLLIKRSLVLLVMPLLVFDWMIRNA